MKNEGGLDERSGRFVILRHIVENPTGQASNIQSHWDLMLESGDKLFTLQLFDWPAICPNGPCQVLLAKRIADHRPLYLDFEGEISGNRGYVRRAAWGRYVSTTDVDATIVRLDAESNRGASAGKRGEERPVPGRSDSDPARHDPARQSSPPVEVGILVLPPCQVDDVFPLEIRNWQILAWHTAAKPAEL